ncbi:beta family protein [Dokdonella ginsengisoli]|uniref:Beta family protein n=1 Tax=Dokdonella ginsengisoli TaxID=363846 RepID=A0ABV9QPD4_9GAMM
MYFSILKWKQGEIRGLSELANDLRPDISVVGEIPPPPWDSENEQPAKPLDEHLRNVPDQIRDIEPRVERIFLDFRQLGSPDDVAALDIMLPGLTEFPTVGFSLGTTTGGYSEQYIARVLQIARDSERPLALRVSKNDMATINFSGFIESWLQAAELNSGRLSLLLDCGDLDQPNLAVITAVCASALKDTRQKGFAHVAVGGTSFPSNLAGFQRGENEIPRHELKLWTDTLQVMGTEPLSFLDYGVTSRDLNEQLPLPAMLQMTANIRYTVRNRFLVFRAGRLREHGYEQFRDLSALITQHQEYAGHTFSWGDRYIWDCAASIVTVGNNTTWRKVATNHHVTFVIDELRKLAAD